MKGRVQRTVSWPPRVGMALDGTGQRDGGTGRRKSPYLFAVFGLLAVVFVAGLFLVRSGVEESDNGKQEDRKRPNSVKEVTPSVPVSTISDVPVTTEVEGGVPKWTERIVNTPSGPKRVKVGYSKAVQAALRSAKSEPILDFRPPPPDPNAPPPPPPRYKNDLHRQLSEYAWSGRFVGTPDPIRDSEARKLVEEKVEILPDDPLEVRQEKETVAAMQEELKEYLANGGHADDYFMELMKRQDAEVETVREAKRQIRDLYKSGDIELAEQAMEKFNEYLKGKGLPALEETPLIKRFRKQAMEKKASGNNK